WRGAHRARGDSLPPLPRFWKALFLAVFAVFGAIYFFNAMAPEISPDGSNYHLGLVGLYLNHGGLYPLETSLYANLSQAIEMLFLFAFPFGRHSAAALMHFAFLLTLPLAMLAYSRRFGFPAAGATGALLVFASPVVGIDGSSAYNDVAAACAVFTTFYLVRIWTEERQEALLILAGLAAGFCYAVKYPAALAGPYALLWVSWKLRREPARCLRSAALVSACALLMAAPWMAKNWIWAGNPFSPYFNRIFPNPYVHIAFEQAWAEFGRHLGIVTSRWQVPWEAAVTGRLNGLLGPVFLLAPLALLGLRRPEGRRLAAAAGVFAIPAAFGIDTRYLIPALPFLALAMAVAVAGSPRILVALALTHTILSLPSNSGLYCSAESWRLSDIPVLAALRIEPEESFLQRRLPEYAIARMVEQKVPPGGRVFAYGGLPQGYTSREIVIEWTSAFNKALCNMLWISIDAELVPARRIEFTVARRPLRALRVIQTARSKHIWSVSELTIHAAGKELPRAPQWRLRARPNPWDVQRAFDNSVLTRWTAGESSAAGMFLEVDFGRPEPVDSVVVRATRDQDGVRLRLDGRLESGEWTTLASVPGRVEDAPPPVMALRRSVAEEFKNARVEYLLIRDGEWGADEFRRNAEGWRLELLGETAGARLYRFR
ncbi:MAG: glycosyltransferase family 39 protein, partial [Bryobacterales bacterium]|nr:glycosyltransferase family 39 protein [Bryobacterales bacterium]